MPALDMGVLVGIWGVWRVRRSIRRLLRGADQLCRGGQMYSILIRKHYRNVYKIRLMFPLVQMCHGDRILVTAMHIYIPEAVEAPGLERKGLPTTRLRSRECRLPNALETPCSSRDLSRASRAATNMERIMRAKLLDGSGEEGREVNAAVETASLGWEKQGLREGASTRTLFLGRVAGFDN
ncbi:hypothetical protein EDD16DRAFT_1569100 [Pisolithus croceorrhizus]|nr:hypothetical protein EDD16DRAFT_1569100 [Pisolithus croceorrhizus]